MLLKLIFDAATLPSGCKTDDSEAFLNQGTHHRAGVVVFANGRAGVGCAWNEEASMPSAAFIWLIKRSCTRRAML